MVDHHEYMRSRDLAGLHALRALAIVAVIAHHARLGGIVHRGIVGVGIFFTLSGYLVTTLLLREHAATGTISLWRFHTRRILRIWPLYFAVLGVYVVVVALLERHTAAGAAFFRNLPHFLTFTTNLGVPRNVAGRVIFVFAWSLATQEQFFLVWPALLRFGRARALPIVALLAFVIADLLVSGCRVAGLLSEDAALVAFFQGSVYTPLCLGGLLAFALHAPGGFDVVSRFAAGRVSAPLAIAVAICAASLDVVPITVFYLTIPLLIAAVVLAPPGLFRRILSARPLVHVGMVSYGVYLMHMLALNLARRIVAGSEPVLAFLLTIPLSVAAATMSQRLLERRILPLREALHRAPAPRLPWSVAARTGPAAFTSAAEQQ